MLRAALAKVLHAPVKCERTLSFKPQNRPDDDYEIVLAACALTGIDADILLHWPCRRFGLMLLPRSCITSWSRLSCGCLILEGERELFSLSDLLQCRTRVEDEVMCERELLVHCIARWKSRSIANKRTATACEDAKDEFVVVLNRNQGQVKSLVAKVLRPKTNLKSLSFLLKVPETGHFSGPMKISSQNLSQNFAW